MCHYCGTAGAPLESSGEEAEAIAELHRAIAETDSDAVHARLLKHGPIPTDQEVLIDAGIRTAQLLDPERYVDDAPAAAIARLQAISMKLRLLSDPSGAAKRAAEELEQRVERYRVDAKRESRAGVRALIILGLVVIAIALGVKRLLQ